MTNHDRTWTDQRMALLDDGWQPDSSAALLRFRATCAAPMQTARWRWALGVAAASLCAAAILLPGPRAVAEYCIECLSAVTVGTPNSQARKAAPGLALADANGSIVELSALRGRVVLVNFWATWCPPCAVEIPYFNHFAAAYRDRDFTAVGVSVDEDGWKAIQTFAARTPMNYPVVLDRAGEAAKAFQVDKLPVTVLIDRRGRIASVYNGIVDRKAAAAEIERLLNE